VKTTVDSIFFVAVQTNDYIVIYMTHLLVLLRPVPLCQVWKEMYQAEESFLWMVEQ